MVGSALDGRTRDRCGGGQRCLSHLGAGALEQAQGGRRNARAIVRREERFDREQFAQRRPRRQDGSEFLPQGEIAAAHQGGSGSGEVERQHSAAGECGEARLVSRFSEGDGADRRSRGHRVQHVARLRGAVQDNHGGVRRNAVGADHLHARQRAEQAKWAQGVGGACGLDVVRHDDDRRRRVQRVEQCAQRGPAASARDGEHV